MGSSEIDADVVAEGVRVLSAAHDQGLPLRLLGGVAVRLRSRNGLPPALERAYGDLDFVTARRASGPAQKFFRELGYAPQPVDDGLARAIDFFRRTGAARAAA